MVVRYIDGGSELLAAKTRYLFALFIADIIAGSGTVAPNNTD